MALPLVSILVLVAGADAPPTRLPWRFGAPVCALVEGLPTPEDPLRKKAPWATAFKALDPAAPIRGKARAYQRIERSIDSLLGEARSVFHPKSAGSFKPTAARRFLARHVLVANPSLAVGEEGFEPVAGLRALLIALACESSGPVLYWARRPGEVAASNAVAVLLLLEGGLEEEARELEPWLPEDGFVGPYAGAELSADPERRRERHATARRRASTPEQQAAIANQARRLGL